MITLTQIIRAAIEAAVIVGFMFTLYMVLPVAMIVSNLNMGVAI